MIKSFKEFIGESIWADLEDRSSGDVVRKEDYVDSLDIHKFCDYLNTLYECDEDNGTIEVVNKYGSEYLRIPLYTIYEKWGQVYSSLKYFFEGYGDTQEDIDEGLQEQRIIDYSTSFGSLTYATGKFLKKTLETGDGEIVVDEDHRNYRHIIKGNGVTNTVCIDVIDCILDNITDLYDMKKGDKIKILKRK